MDGGSAGPASQPATNRRRDQFKLKMGGGVSKQIRTLGIAKCWTYVKDGVRSKLPDALNRLAKLTDVQAHGYTATLQSACESCLAVNGEAHSPSCQVPKKAKTVALDPKQPKISIFARAQLPGFASVTSSKAREKPAEFGSSSSAAPSLSVASGMGALLASAPVPPAPLLARAAPSSAPAAASAAAPSSAPAAAVALSSAPAAPSAAISVLAQAAASSVPAATSPVAPAAAPSSASADGEATDDAEWDSDEEEGEEKQMPHKTLGKLRETTAKYWKVLRDKKLVGSRRRIPFEDALSASGESPGKVTDPAVQALSGTCFFIFDPMTTSPELVGDVRLVCPKCNSCLERKGYSKSIRIERSFKEDVSLLVSCELACISCPESAAGCRSSNYTTLHPDIFKQFPDVVRWDFPFVVVENGSVISTSTLATIMTLKEKGTSYKSIGDASREGLQTRFLDLEMKRRGCVINSDKQRKALKLMCHTMLPVGSVTDFWVGFAISPKIAKSFYLREAFRQDPMIQALFSSFICSTSTVNLDMVHPWGHSGSKEGSVGIWVIMNGLGEILAVRSATSKSLEDAGGILKALAKVAEEKGHKIKVVYTDNPADDCNELRLRFGEDVTVRKDPFHLIADLMGLARKKSKHRVGWEEAVSAAFWSFNKDDVAKELARLKESEPANAQKLSESFRYLMHCRRVRHSLKTAKDIEEQLRSIANKFSLEGALEKDFHVGINNATATIRKYLSDHPADVVIHVNVGTEDDPHWRYMQGTNLSECFNRGLNALHLERLSREQGHAGLVRYAWRFSHTERMNFRGLDLLAGMTDPVRQNDFILQQQVLVANNLIQADQVLFANVVAITPNHDKASYLSGMYHSLGSMSDKVLDYIASGGAKSELPKHVRKRLAYDVSTSLEGANIHGMGPFDSKEETDVLLRVLHTPKIYHAKGQRALFASDGTFRLDKLLSVAKKGEFDKLINLQQLAWMWNCSFLLDVGETVTWEGLVIENASKIKGKEVVHFREILKKLAKKAAAKLHSSDVQSAMNVVAFSPSSDLPPMTLPIADTPSAGPVQFGAVAPVALASADPASINHSVPGPAPAKKKKKRSAPKSESQDTSEPESKRTNDEERCEDCGFIRHTQTSPCPFNRWQKEHADGIVRLNANEGPSAARRRIWKTVRHHFVPSAGTYLSGEGWTCHGPPAPGAVAAPV